MQTNAVQTFVHEEFGKVRTVIINSDIHFVGKDVAKALGYVDTKSAIRTHVDDEDKRWRQITTHGGVQMMFVINESGLFSLILGSKLPRAKAFKRWVTSVVLPALRATGSFSVSEKTDPAGDFSPPPSTTPSSALTVKGKVDVLMECARLAKSARLRNKILYELLLLITGKKF